MLSKKQKHQIKNAIDLGWKLRPVVFTKNSYKFININDEYGKKLDDTDQLLTSIEDLEKFPRHNTITTVSLVSPLHKNFLCLDFDSKDLNLKKEIIKYLKDNYDKNDLFLRIGNKEKIGQFWFICNDNVSYMTTPLLDIITTQWRCDAIGQYKNFENQEYHWPFKKIYENPPEELPIITKQQVNDIKTIVSKYAKEDISLSTSAKGRHGFFLNEINKGMYNGESFDEIYLRLKETDEYTSAKEDRPNEITNELIRLFSGVMRNKIASNDFKEQFKEDAVTSFEDVSDFKPTQYPEVEKGSFIDILTRSVRRNQYKNSKKLPFFSSLATSAWLLSFSVRLGRLAPNLMVLYAANSGSGKSDSGKIVRELIKLCPSLATSIDEDVNSTAQFITSFGNSPNHFFLFNEFSSVLKKINSSSISFMSDLPEKIMRYYNDYSDTTICYAPLKDTVYGVCYGPKLSSLMFTTPENFNLLSETSFDSGLGRRLFTVVDRETYFFKKNRPFVDKYFNEKETKAIKSFLNNFVFVVRDIEDEDWDDIYETKDISNLKLILSKSVTQKDGIKEVYHRSAKAPMIRHKLKLSKEVENYLANVFVDKINNLIKQASLTANNKKKVAANSYGEFVTKLAMIHSTAGRKVPSTTIEMDSIKWAEEMVDFYLNQNLQYDLESVFEDEEIKSNKIVGYAEKFKNKLIENKIREFSFSHNICRSFFRGDKKRAREEVFRLLILSNFLHVKNEDVSKKYFTYQIFEESINAEKSKTIQTPN